MSAITFDAPVQCFPAFATMWYPEKTKHISASKKACIQLQGISPINHAIPRQPLSAAQSKIVTNLAIQSFESEQWAIRRTKYLKGKTWVVSEWESIMLNRSA